MESESIPKGYKQTEIGIVPEDWDIVDFGELINYTKGYAFKSKDYTRSGIRIIRVSDTTFDSISDENLIFVSTETSPYYKKWFLKENDLIFSTVGSKPPMYDSLVGRAIMITSKHSGCLLNQNAVLIRLKNKTKEGQIYLLNHFRTGRYVAFIEKIFRGNANQASITLHELFKFQIPIPSFPEQQAIAEVLSDTDALIDSLSKLIEKKKLIKQGSMQQLLTGKKRLPGFSGEWETKLFSKIFEIDKGKQLNKSELSEKGLFPAWNGGIEPSGYTHQWNRQSNTITISEGGNSCGFVNLCRTKFWCGGHCYSLKILNEKYVKKFLYQLLKFQEPKIMSLRIGSGLPNIQKKHLNEFEIKISDDAQEQEAIAQVLSDMDAEIEALEQKKHKYEQIKQGMMQQLLTGKIRLKWKQ